MQRLINFLLQRILRVFFKLILKEEKDPYIKKIIDLYKKNGFTYLFAKIRIWDSPFAEVERFIPKRGTILDLGCGDGFFANYLALKSSKRKVIGIEINKDRVKDANKGLENTQFIKEDVTKSKLNYVDVILMFHLLHHLHSKKAQISLIKYCVKKLKKDGKLLIVEVDRKPLVKYLFSYLIDTIIVPILFDKKLTDFNIHYRSQDEWIKLLKSFNLKISTRKADTGKPFSHIIIEALNNEKN